MRNWIDSVSKLFEARARSEPMTPLANHIARHGGLKLDGDARAADFHKVFIPGAGPLARKSGRSVDDWRNNLADNGFIERDPDGYMSRDIRGELYDLLHAEQRRRVFGDGASNEQAHIDDHNVEYDLFKQEVNADLIQHGQTHVDPELLSVATHLMWSGEYDNALDAYERAAMMAGNETQSHAHTGEDDIPF